MENLFFVIGAPRSGTKIFRDTLGAGGSVATSDHPLEEVWSIGREDTDHDQYEADDVTPEIREKIREAFREKLESNRIYVEKNVRNSLRVPYIRAVFPRAKFIHIVRDGRDAIASLRTRWRNPIDWDYYLSLRSLRLSPRDIVYYSVRLGWKFVRRLLKGESHVDVWGPHYPGLREDLRERTLFEVCVRQWKYCVEQARDEGARDEDSYFEFRYENLVENPADVLAPLSEFVGLDDPDPWVDFARRELREDSIGRWRDEFTDSELRTFNEVAGDLHDELGYSSCSGDLNRG